VAAHLNSLRPLVLITSPELLHPPGSAPSHTIPIHITLDLQSGGLQNTSAIPAEHTSTASASAHAPQAGGIAAAYRRARALNVDDPGDIVCIYSTSGSCGTPKYVAVGAVALLHRLAWNDIDLQDIHSPTELPDPAQCPKSDSTTLKNPQVITALQQAPMASCGAGVDGMAVVAVKTSVAFVDSLWETLAPVVFGAPRH
jgi:hypothetical protein